MDAIVHALLGARPYSSAAELGEAPPLAILAQAEGPGMDGEERAAAWEELYDALPDGWAVMHPQWREADHLWAVYARRLIGAQHTGGQWHEAFGQTEAIALRALAQQFRNLRQ